MCQTKPIENETIKHLVFACVASNDGKRGFAEAKLRYFNKEVIKEYSKQGTHKTKYSRKCEEIESAIKFVDKIGNANKASYNIQHCKDQNGHGCYSVVFNINYKGEDVMFSFHVPKKALNKLGNNNYPKIKEVVYSNTHALKTVLQTNEIFESGISMLELYA